METFQDGPNEFFSNNWVYEGLVAYGQGGQILPSLASKWTVTPNDIGGDNYVFQLRENVTFHDGAHSYSLLFRVSSLNCYEWNLFF